MNYEMEGGQGLALGIVREEHCERKDLTSWEGPWRGGLVESERGRSALFVESGETSPECRPPDPRLVGTNTLGSCDEKSKGLIPPSSGDFARSRRKRQELT